MKSLLPILIWIITQCTLVNVDAQKITSDSISVLERLVIEGDTIYVTTLEEVHIFPKKHFNNRWQERKYTRLVRNVKAAYPYAIMARDKYIELNDRLSNSDREKDHRQIIKEIEKEIMDEYEDELKGLTITQGRILLKLIDRELGNTSYEVVKELKGAFSAVFWQTIARIFGSNLKSEYDPAGEDKPIEDIVKMIEMGLI